MLDAKKRQMVPLRYNEAQVALREEIEWFHGYRLPVRIVACKSRRAGISTGVEAEMYHDTSNNENTNTLIIANQGKPSENVLQMATRFWQSTPDQIAGIRIRPALPDSYRNNPPKDRLEFPELNSNFFVASARSLDQYLSFGFQNQHATEVGYYADGYGLFRALDPTLVDDSHSMQVLESTPNGMTGRGEFFYEQCMRANENVQDNVIERGVTRLLFIAWHQMAKSFSVPFADDGKRRAFGKTLKPHEKDWLARFEHISLEQIAWTRAIMRKPAFNNDPEMFDQEYPTDLATAFLSSGKSIFSRAAIKRYMSRVRPPIWRGDVYWGSSDKENKKDRIYDTVRRPKMLSHGEALAEGFSSHTIASNFNNLKVWEWPKKGDRLFIAGDVAGGDPDTNDGDYSILKVGRLNDSADVDEVIMTWRGRLNPLDFGEVACALAWFCYIKTDDDSVAAPELAIEWNGPGVSCNTYIDKYKLYPHMFTYVQPSVKGQPKSKHIGWESNAKTKPMMVDYLQRSIERDLIDEPDETTILEMTAYRQIDDFGDSGSYGGQAGTHDDNVSALQILNVRLRYNQATGTPEDVITIDDVDDSADDTVPWDPFDRRSPTTADDDSDIERLVDDTDEESLFFHRSVA